MCSSDLHLGLLDDPEFHQRHQQLAEQLKQRHGISIHQFSELVRIWEYEEEERRANECLAMAEAYLRNSNKRSLNPPTNKPKEEQDEQELQLEG